MLPCKEIKPADARVVGYAQQELRLHHDAVIGDGGSHHTHVQRRYLQAALAGARPGNLLFRSVSRRIHGILNHQIAEEEIITEAKIGCRLLEILIPHLQNGL